MTESKALRELKRGSEEALAWFIDQYGSYVSTIIHNIIGAYLDKADVEEVASDVFFALWNNAEKVKPLSVKGYLGSIARNMAKNKLRRIGRELPLEEQSLIVDELTPETRFQCKALSAAVRRAVLEMRQPEREIFLRFYYYGQTAERIASEMELNPSTVRSKLRRGRETLRASLAKYL